MLASAASRRWIVVVLAATLTDAMIGRHLQIGPWHPNLLLASLVYLGLTAGRTTAVALGFLAGLYADLHAPQLLGMHALGYTVAAYLAGMVGEKVQADRTSIQMISLLALSVLNDALVGIISGARGLPSFLLLRALPSAVYTTALGLLLVTLLSDWLMPREWARHATSRRRRVR